MNTRTLERALLLRTRLDKLPTEAVLDALQRPWYQIVGGAVKRAAAAQVLGGRPSDVARTVPALSRALGDRSKQVVTNAGEALCLLIQKATIGPDDIRTIAQSAAGALDRNLWGMPTPILLQLLARCGVATAPHIPRIEMSLRYAHLSQPVFIGRLHVLWGSCALVKAGTSADKPLEQIAKIMSHYTKALTQSPADRVAELSRSLGPSASGLSVAGALFSDAVSDFGFDLMLLEALEVLGEMARPLRSQLDILQVALTDEVAKRRLQAVIQRCE